MCAIIMSDGVRSCKKWKSYDLPAEDHMKIILISNYSGMPHIFMQHIKKEERK